MVSVIQRMRKLRSLLAVRVGPGAAVLPPEVTRIHMSFAKKIEDGHSGAKKFWRHCLPRLKYHNPATPMTIERFQNQNSAAVLTIHLTSHPSSPPISSTTSSSTSTAPVASTTPGAATESTIVINMKHQNESQILAKVLDLTKARVLRATAEEMRQLRELEEQNEKSERDRERMAVVSAHVKREKALLEQARGAIALET